MTQPTPHNPELNATKLAHSDEGGEATHSPFAAALEDRAAEAETASKAPETPEEAAEETRAEVAEVAETAEEAPAEPAESQEVVKERMTFEEAHAKLAEVKSLKDLSALAEEAAESRLIWLQKTKGTWRATVIKGGKAKREKSKVLANALNAKKKELVATKKSQRAEAKKGPKRGPKKGPKSKRGPKKAPKEQVSEGQVIAAATKNALKEKNLHKLEKLAWSMHKLGFVVKTNFPNGGWRVEPVEGKEGAVELAKALNDQRKELKSARRNNRQRQSELSATFEELTKSA